MSDVMGRLLARASGAASAVEPVLTSRFEPAAPPAEHAAVADVAKPAASESVPSASRAEDASREPILEVRQDRVTTRLASEKIVQQTRVEKARDVVAAENPPQAPAPVEPLPVPGAPDIRTESPAPAADPGREAAPIEVRVHIAEPDREAAEPEDGPARHLRPASTNRSVERPSASALPPMKAESVPPVDVQVTIGHVELRMVQPPARPVPARRPATPRVTLDEYLRRRNGETR